MEITKNYFYVKVSMEDGSSFDVGPFEKSGGFRLSDGAIDWIYKQIGLLKSKFPEAVLVKDRWNYKEKGAGVFGDSAIVDIKVSIAGFSFEIVPLKRPRFADVIDELIEPRPTVEKI